METLIVTGGSSGIGRAALSHLEGDFARTINIDIHDKDNPIDVRDYAKVEEVVSDAIIPATANALVANAGVAFFIHPITREPMDFASTPIQYLHDMVNINLIGQINVLHAFVKATLEKDAYGRIVVVSSISAEFTGGPGMTVYDATKAALCALAKGLVAYGPRIKINTILPGSVATNIGGWDRELSQDSRGAKFVRDAQQSDNKLIKDEVTLTHISRAIEFLLLVDNGMSGTNIMIDGGLTSMGRGGYQ